MLFRSTVTTLQLMVSLQAALTAFPLDFFPPVFKHPSSPTKVRSCTDAENLCDNGSVTLSLTSLSGYTSGHPLAPAPPCGQIGAPRNVLERTRGVFVLFASTNARVCVSKTPENKRTEHDLVRCHLDTLTYRARLNMAAMPSAGRAGSVAFHPLYLLASFPAHRSTLRWTAGDATSYSRSNPMPRGYHVTSTRGAGSA